MGEMIIKADYILKSLKIITWHKTDWLINSHVIFYLKIWLMTDLIYLSVFFGVRMSVPMTERVPMLEQFWLKFWNGPNMLWHPTIKPFPEIRMT